MSSILRKFYRGELFPSERQTEKAPSFLRAQAKAFEAGEALTEHLTPDQKKRFDAYFEARERAFSLEAEDCFLYGFRLGLLMGIEACGISDRYMSDPDGRAAEP